MKTTVATQLKFHIFNSLVLTTTTTQRNYRKKIFIKSKRCIFLLLLVLNEHPLEQKKFLDVKFAKKNRTAAKYQKTQKSNDQRLWQRKKIWAQLRGLVQKWRHTLMWWWNWIVSSVLTKVLNKVKIGKRAEKKCKITLK